MRALSIAALLALAGCTALDQDPTLSSFSDCEDLRGYMADMAQREARASHTFTFAIGLGCMESTMVLGGRKDEDGDYEEDYADDYSTTNVQEQGVDEADLVKTDGRHVYAIAGEWLITSVGWPLEEAEEVHRLAIGGQPSGLYLYDDVIVVISETWGEEEEGPGGLVTVLDAADPTAPTVVRETSLSGDVRSTRRIGQTLYVVSYLDVEVASPWEDLREIKRQVAAAEPEDWLPRSSDRVLGEDGTWSTTEGPACGCEDVFWSPRETGTFMTVVSSLDLSDPTSSFTGQAVVGRADIVYASREGLYVAYSEEMDGPFRSLDPQLDSVVHKFDIGKGEERPEYVDTVQLTGVLVNQFSLSERAGVLRAATTDEATWTTHVWTLAEDEGGDLERLDHLGGLAPGEELYSVRFVGDLGYLVTYEVADRNETVFDIEFGDPLFTLDLSDPTEIVAVGELVMNGWSDYIHPLGEDHLLTVGMDEAEDETWRVAVSLFDVSDLADPILEDRELLHARSSEAQTEHHAFTYLASQSALTLPIQTLEWDWALAVLHADTEGVEAIGQLTQDTVNSAVVVEDDWDWNCTRIRRSVIMEDKVWAMSEGGLTAAALAEPGVELAAVPFRGIGECGWVDE